MNDSAGSEVRRCKVVVAEFISIGIKAPPGGARDQLRRSRTRLGSVPSCQRDRHPGDDEQPEEPRGSAPLVTTVVVVVIPLLVFDNRTTTPGQLTALDTALRAEVFDRNLHPSGETPADPSYATP